MRPEVRRFVEPPVVLGPRDLDGAERPRCGVDHWTSSSRGPPTALEVDGRGRGAPPSTRRCGGGTSTRRRRARRSRRRRARRRGRRRPTPRPSAPSRARGAACTRRRIGRRSSRAVAPGRRSRAITSANAVSTRISYAASGPAKRAGRREAVERRSPPPRTATTRRARRRRASGRARAGTRRAAVPGSRSAPNAQASCGWSSGGRVSAQGVGGGSMACLYTWARWEVSRRSASAASRSVAARPSSSSR